MDPAHDPVVREAFERRCYDNSLSTRDALICAEDVGRRIYPNYELERFIPRYGHLINAGSLQDLFNNQLAGVAFVLFRALFQGRQDWLSLKVFEILLNEMARVFGDGVITQNRIDTLESDLIRRRSTPGKHYYRKSDVILMAELLRKSMKFRESFARRILDRIISDNIPSAHLELDEIRYIGPKIASFTMRDILIIGIRNNFINEDSARRLNRLHLVLPIDVHVFNFLKRRQIVREEKLSEKNHVRIARSLYDASMSYGLTPFYVDAGIWLSEFARSSIG